jgi:hypothetical protein
MTQFVLGHHRPRNILREVEVIVSPKVKLAVAVSILATTNSRPRAFTVYRDRSRLEATVATSTVVARAVAEERLVTAAVARVVTVARVVAAARVVEVAAEKLVVVAVADQSSSLEVKVAVDPNPNQDQSTVTVTVQTGVDLALVARIGVDMDPVVRTGVATLMALRTVPPPGPRGAVVGWAGGVVL